MGIPILIIGKSGSGKSSSLRNFKDAGVINVLGKPLPFKDAPKAVCTDDYRIIKETLTKCKARSVVIDDAGYLMTNQFMKGHSNQGAGNAIFSFYNDLGDNFWGLIRFISEGLPTEKLVYVIMHEETDEFGNTKPKSIGKMLDEKVCIEGMFTIALRSIINNGKYVFKTNSDGFDVCKTPMGMFDTEEIDNDLKAVDDKIREFFNIKGE